MRLHLPLPLSWRGIIVVLFAFSFYFPPQPALADVAPPESPPGANLTPGSETTQVRMLSELVTLEVLPTSQIERWPAQARMTAVFQMHNLGNQAEDLAIRFPLTFWSGSSDGFGEYPG